MSLAYRPRVGRGAGGTACALTYTEALLRMTLIAARSSGKAGTIEVFFYLEELSSLTRHFPQPLEARQCPGSALGFGGGVRGAEPAPERSGVPALGARLAPRCGALLWEPRPVSRVPPR